MATDVYDRPPTEDRARTRSLGSLFSDLTSETTTLVRKEIELAKAEMSQKIDRALGGIASLAAGVAALDALLDQWWPTQWLAPLIVGLVVCIVGYVLLQKGRSDVKPDNLLPRRTFRSLRRDGELARTQVR
jgi:xanthine/uracil permease